MLSNSCQHKCASSGIVLKGRAVTLTEGSASSHLSSCIRGKTEFYLRSHTATHLQMGRYLAAGGTQPAAQTHAAATCHVHECTLAGKQHDPLRPAGRSNLAFPFWVGGRWASRGQSHAAQELKWRKAETTVYTSSSIKRGPSAES